jgi:hypothetical protein
MKNLKIVFTDNGFPHLSDNKVLHDLRLKQTLDIFEKMSKNNTKEDIEIECGKLYLEYPDSEIGFLFNIDKIDDDFVYVSFDGSIG